MKFKSPLLIAALLLPHLLFAAEPSEVVQGRISQMTTSLVTIEGVGTFTLDLSQVQCFDFRGARTTCETLAGVGYADKARMTLVGNVVRRIDLIELQQ